MRRNDTGIFGAAVAAAAIVTAGFPWQSVLAGWAVGALLAVLVWRIPRGHHGKLPALVTLLGGIIILAAAALGAEDAFPEDSTFPFVSLVLMLLTLRAMVGERTTGAAVANIIGLFLLPLVTVTVLLGLRDVSWRENIPEGLQWTQVWVAAAGTAPWWCFRKGPMDRKGWLWFGGGAVLAVGMSLLTHGVLGAALCGYEPFPLYRAVQSIRGLGGVRRLEALLAAAVLMGAFGLMLLAAEKVAAALEELLPGTPMGWKGGASVAAAFCVEWAVRAMRDSVTVRFEAVFWGLIPVWALWVVFTEKIQKSDEKA